LIYTNPTIYAHVCPPSYNFINEGHTAQYTVARRMEQMPDLQSLGGILLQMDVTTFDGPL